MKAKFQIALLKAGLSQVELAARLGIHPSTISRIVGGYLLPPTEVQEAIRAALHPWGKQLKFGFKLTKKKDSRGRRWKRLK